MIVVNLKNKFFQIEKEKIKCLNDNRVCFIEQIHNEFDETLVKINHNSYVNFYNLKKKLHNPAGPALLLFTDAKVLNFEEYWYNGKKHRQNGPAYTKYFPDGKINKQSYIVNDKLHRLDGPAHIEYFSDGVKRLEYYFINGVRHSEISFKKTVNDYNNL